MRVGFSKSVGAAPKLDESAQEGMRSTTITRLKIHAAILAVVCLVLPPTIAAARGGEEHVTGTLVEFDPARNTLLIVFSSTFLG
jgi:hypothetical protein